MNPGTIDGYGGHSKFLHWLIAGLAFTQLAIGKFFEIEPARPDGGLFNLGYTLPPLPQGTPDWQRIAARTTQGTFYLLLFALPVPVWLIWVASYGSGIWLGMHRGG